MKSEKPLTLEQLAKKIYQTKFCQLTPLQQEELREHQRAEERIRTLTLSDKTELLIRGLVGLKEYQKNDWEDL